MSEVKLAQQEPPPPPVPGLIVRTEEGLGMVVRVSDTDYTVQVFSVGQRWVPMGVAEEPQRPKTTNCCQMYRGWHAETCPTKLAEDPPKDPHRA